VGNLLDRDIGHSKMCGNVGEIF